MTELEDLRNRAEAGDAEAQNNIGWMYFFGRGVARDDTEAVRSFRLAADQGHTLAQHSGGGPDPVTMFR